MEACLIIHSEKLDRFAQLISYNGLVLFNGGEYRSIFTHNKTKCCCRFHHMMYITIRAQSVPLATSPKPV